IEGVGLAVGASAATVSTVDLDDRVTAAAKEARQPDAVAASALDPKLPWPAEPLRPARKRGVAGAVGADRELAEASSQLIQSHGDVQCPRSRQTPRICSLEFPRVTVGRPAS